MLTLDKIYHASYVLKDVVRPTDMIHATNLSDDCELYLKTENLQVTGAFKARGAFYKISQLTDEETMRRVLRAQRRDTASSRSSVCRMPLRSLR